VKFEVSPKGQGGEWVGVANIDVGHDRDTGEDRLPSDDLLKDAAADPAGMLETTDDQAGQLGGVGKLQH
jgi:hypothetical protein